jgi:uncharacterized membrane protein
MTSSINIDKESHLRTLLKTMSWRIIATTTIIGISYFTTGSIALALEIGFVEFFVKMILYYVHERAWQLAPRGSIRKLWRDKYGK